MIILHFAGEKQFSDQLKRHGFGEGDIPKIITALFAVSRIDACVVQIPEDKVT